LDISPQRIIVCERGTQKVVTMAVNPVVTAEAKRVVSIMEEMAHDLDVIALIPTPDTYDPASFSHLPHDLQKELQEYITKEEQFQDMMTFYRDRPVAPQKVRDKNILLFLHHTNSHAIIHTVFSPSFIPFISLRVHVPSKNRKLSNCWMDLA
jgi:hypothetical protein